MFVYYVYVNKMKLYFVRKDCNFLKLELKGIRYMMFNFGYIWVLCVFLNSLIDRVLFLCYMFYFYSYIGFYS